ncbi:MAG TPA: MlaD family protein [Nocardioides sp.]|nr:MlaD family protein [Nocardioides sp.]
MTRGVRIRLMAFVALSAIGIVYITASYLGVIDKVTGRELTVQATLPSSGGLYVGSEVTYRGVKIGKVSKVVPTADGIDATLTLEKDTKLPASSPIQVHNLSAVGEQYLDFTPASSDGPYAQDGTVFHGTAASLPVDEGDLLVTLNDFVQSVDKKDLQSSVAELGAMFHGTGRDLQKLLDGGSTFIREASKHTRATITLLDSGLKVLKTQSGQKENIRSFAKDLDHLTGALRRSDGDLRTVIHETPSAARELQALLEDLGPTMPTMLSDLISVGQVFDANLAGIEQLLVTYPALIAGGPTGSTRDGWGHVNLQFDYSVPPCTEGYLPPSQWRSTQDVTDEDSAFGGLGHYPAVCKSPLPFERRGTDQALAYTAGTNSSPARNYSVTSNEESGVLPYTDDGHGRPVRFQKPQNLSVLGGDAWKWLLVGPVVQK